MRIRTHMRAGGSGCDPWSTNCKGVDLATGKVFWDNCHHWQPFAGQKCWDRAGAVDNVCYKC